MKNKIILTQEQIKTLNDICFRELVTEEGKEFKYPFMEGTEAYIKGFGVDLDIVQIEEEMEGFGAISNLISGTRYSTEDLIEMGKMVLDDV